ncbi:MAG: AAA-like domain-containing protein [Acidobacteriota bacterium]|nr:AAA-like domain-containing protein [Blastocatellia bacterium]MDW8413510.1 AAA-like domain-containing protein [Acidobacteriota bacterium]
MNTSEFYVTGGTLRRDAPCYVHRRADEELYENLVQGKFCYVLTSRQMGKSSLMVRTAVRLRKEGFRVAVLDLTAIGQNLSVEQWYSGLIYRIGQQLDIEDDIEDFWQQLSAAPLQRWMRALTEVVLDDCRKLVIFIDEIDAVRSLPFSTDEFFAGIRELYNRRTEDAKLTQLTFCLLGVATPSDLIKNVHTTPFNIGYRIELTDFSESEAYPLIKGLEKDEQTARRILRRVLYWTGGHPYLTQRLFLEISKHPEIVNDHGVDTLCRELFLSARAREKDDNLLFVREKLLRGSEDLSGLLELYRRVRRRRVVKDDETNRLVSLLNLSGITTVRRARLVVRNRIYYYAFDEEWIDAHLPDAELRRQRAAYHKGLLSATMVSSVIVLIMLLLFLWALREARRADANFQQAQLNAVDALRASQDAEKQRRSALEQQALAEQQRLEAEEQRREALEQQKIALEQRRLALEGRKLLEHQVQVNKRLLYAAQINLAMQAWKDGNIARAVELLSGHLPKSGEPDLRGFEWYYLWKACNSQLHTLRHESGISSIKLQGNLLVTGGRDGSMKLWDIEKLTQLYTLTGHNREVRSLDISPSRKLLASASADTTLRLWDLTSYRNIAVIKHDSELSKLKFSPDGRLLATGDFSAKLNVRDIVAGNVLLYTVDFPDRITSIQFSPDGNHLAVGDRKGEVRIIDPKTGTQLTTLKAGTHYIWATEFSSNGKLLATAGADAIVRIWNTATWSLLAESPKLSDWINALTFSQDNKLIAIASRDGSIHILDIETLQQIQTIKGHTYEVREVIFLNKLLISGSWDGTVRIWDIERSTDWITLNGHKGRVYQAIFSPDQRLLATAGEDREIRIWSVSDNYSLLKTIDGHTADIRSIDFSPDSKLLASASYDGTVKIWDVNTAECLQVLNQLGQLACVTFSPDGKFIATSSRNGSVTLWSASSGKEVYALKGHNSWVGHVVFSSDGKMIVTCSEDNTAQLWDIHTGKRLSVLSNYGEPVRSAVFFDKDRKLAIAGRDGSVALWDISSKKEYARLRGHSGSIWSLSCTKDAKRLITASADKTIKMWDLEAQQELATLHGHEDWVWSVSFSPDGTAIASAGGDGKVNIWSSRR